MDETDFRYRLALANPAFRSHPSKRRSSVALIIRLNSARTGVSEPQLLFILRSVNPLDRWSGHVAFPGGRQQATDKSDYDTVVRETYEEIGLRLDDQFVFCLTFRFGNSTDSLPAEIYFASCCASMKYHSSRSSPPATSSPSVHSVP